MWREHEFETYVESTFGEGKYKSIISKMKEIVIATILGTQ